MDEMKRFRGRMPEIYFASDQLIGNGNRWIKPVGSNGR
jgi:hypothetical protein